MSSKEGSREERGGAGFDEEFTLHAVFQKLQQMSLQFRNMEDRIARQEVTLQNIQGGRGGPRANPNENLEDEDVMGFYDGDDDRDRRVQGGPRRPDMGHEEDMVHMAMKMERQLKKKGTTRYTSTSWKPKWEGGGRSEGAMSKARVEPPKGGRWEEAPSKPKVESHPSQNRDIKCFK
ncbi:unnamed protein product [Ilex paraguariensis]|uniref:Uncharacterized protein n=1 Tax=Ilex paraguariensis TaxID=185542 RepID=A0ABC8SCV7_9AQUA